MESAKRSTLRARLLGGLRRWGADEGGVTAIEYGLLAALIAVACVAAFSATGASLSGMYAIWTAAVLAAI